MTRTGAALAFCFVLASPVAAHAQTTADQRAAAQALFDDARKLIADKRWADACPKLEESQRLDPGLGTLLNLAECQSQIGKTASAWANFLEAAYQAKAANQAKREATARARATALEPRLSKLTILAVPGTSIEIRRDGTIVTASLVGTAVPVDPGEHTVTATGAGKRPWSTKVVVRAEGHQVTVSVPQLEDGQGGPLPPPEVRPPPVPEVKPPPPSDGSSVPPPPPATPDVDNGRGARIGGIALVAAGGVGLVIGAAFTVLAKQKLDSSNSQGCNATTNVCKTQAAFDLRSDAHTYGNAATGGWIAGSIVAAGGIGLLVASTVMKNKTSGVVVIPTLASDPRGAAVLGAAGRF